MPIEVGTKLGAYEVAEPLGAGGMGEVYRARDTKLSRDVALKVLPEEMARGPQRMARFEREARTLASLNHTNIAAIYGLEESEGVTALVMELVEGETLQERIARSSNSRASSSGGRKGLQPEECLDIAKQIAEALEYAHERGVIHRDLKPANVKIAPEGTVKVLDFGLAKVLSNEDSASMDPGNSPTLSAIATQEGIILGTAAYMAPEQAKGKQVDRRADIWAFGCVLFEMLTGKKAFDGETITDILAAVVMKDPDWTLLPEATPPAIQGLVRRCLEKDARQRLRDIGDARISIEETLSGAGSDAEAAVYGPTAAKRTSPLRRALPWVLATTTVLFASSTAWLALQPRPRQSVMRFSVSPPENTQFAARDTLSISPDGRELVFVAAPSSGGPTLLWVRSLDSLTARALQGTEGAHWPFWSPDSKQIGFYANGKLEKVTASGGPVQTLCDASGAGATWNRDGVILFSDHDSLYRLPDTGGTPKLVAARNAAFAGYLLPQFLPDGRHFLVLARASALGAATATATVKVGSLDSEKTQTLLKGSSDALYVRPGYLFYVQQNNLVARGFDARSLKFTGQAVPVAENISVANASWAPFSVSQSGVLAYQAGGGGVQDEMVWFDRKGQKLGTVGQPGDYAEPAISPDGARLAVESVGPGGSASDLWIYDLKRGTGSRLTFTPALNLSPAWSKDGSRIYFSSDRNGKHGIYEKPADGLGNTQQVYLSSHGFAYLNYLSPDGHYAMFMTTSPTASEWALPLSGDRKPFVYLQGHSSISSAAFSPDGRYVAYVSDETGRKEVYVQTFPQHLGKWQISTAGGNDPTWRSDGKELFYLNPNDELMSVDVTTGSGGFQAGTPKPLFHQPLIGPFMRNQYEVSPDGQRFLMLVPASQAKPEPITVVSNWPALLKK